MGDSSAAQVGQNRSSGGSNVLHQQLQQPLTREQRLQNLACEADARRSALMSPSPATRQDAMKELVDFARANRLTLRDVESAVRSARGRFGPPTAASDRHDMYCAARPQDNLRSFGSAPANSLERMLQDMRPNGG